MSTEQMDINIDGIIAEFDGDQERMVAAILLSAMMLVTKSELQEKAMLALLKSQTAMGEKLMNISGELEVLKAQVSMIGVDSAKRH